MKLQTMRNPWTCMATSWAMVLNISVEDIFKEVGHDGSKLIWKELEDDRFNHAGHHIQELIDVALNHGVLPVSIHANPYHGHFLPGVQAQPLWDQEYNDKRISKYLKGNIAVLEGTVGFNFGHAVAYADECIFDPRGSIIPIDKFEFNLQVMHIVK